MSWSLRHAITGIELTLFSTLPASASLAAHLQGGCYTYWSRSPPHRQVTFACFSSTFADTLVIWASNSRAASDPRPGQAEYDF